MTLAEGLIRLPKGLPARGLFQCRAGPFEFARSHVEVGKSQERIHRPGETEPSLKPRFRPTIMLDRFELRRRADWLRLLIVAGPRSSDGCVDLVATEIEGRERHLVFWIARIEQPRHAQQVLGFFLLLHTLAERSVETEQIGIALLEAGFQAFGIEVERQIALSTSGTVETLAHEQADPIVVSVGNGPIGLARAVVVDLGLFVSPHLCEDITLAK